MRTEEVFGMFGRIGNLFVLVMVLCLAVTFASCGGGGPTGPGMSRPGRIYVLNDIDVERGLYHLWFGRRGIQPVLTVTVRYLDEEEHIIKTDVGPGEKKEVSRELIEGGTKVKVHIRFDRFVVEEEISIDGSFVIRVTDIIELNYSFDYEISSA